MPPKSKKRKRESTKSEQQEQISTNELDTSHSVLGGLKGGYRRTGTTPEPPAANTNPSNASSFPKQNVTTFSIPFGEKSIVCERHGQHAKSPVSLIFTHGAGGGISNPATVQFCQGFSKRSPVLCFQGTMNLQNRVKSFHATLDYLVGNHGKRSDFVLGGRSMGARAAVQTALDREDEVKALILVSYPLVSAGKKGETRDQLLYELPSGMNVLFVSGTQDGMCDLGHLETVRSKMKAKTWLIKVDGADHGMSVKPKDAVQAVRGKTGMLAGSWLEENVPAGGEVVIRWDSDGKRIANTGWSDQRAQIEKTPARTESPSMNSRPKGGAQKKRKA